MNAKELRELLEAFPPDAPIYAYAEGDPSVGIFGAHYVLDKLLFSGVITTSMEPKPGLPTVNHLYTCLLLVADETEICIQDDLDEEFKYEIATVTYYMGEYVQILLLD